MAYLMHLLLHRGWRILTVNNREPLSLTHFRAKVLRFQPQIVASLTATRQINDLLPGSTPFRNTDHLLFAELSLPVRHLRHSAIMNVRQPGILHLAVIPKAYIRLCVLSKKQVEEAKGPGKLSG
jgi:hypothetical protein